MMIISRINNKCHIDSDVDLTVTVAIIIRCDVTCVSGAPNKTACAAFTLSDAFPL